MKKILTIVAIAAMSLGVGAIAFAQDAGPQNGAVQTKTMRKPGGVVKLMELFQTQVLESLSLSDDQKKKIADLNTDLDSKMKDIVTQNKGTTGNKNIGAQQRQVLTDYNSSLEDVLGPDLWRQYRMGMLVKMKDARERRQERQQAAEAQTKSDNKDMMGDGGGGN